MLSLPGPVEVRAAILAPGGVLDADPLPRMVVDLSTNSPAPSPSSLSGVPAGA
jgi:hypothetical protein